MNYKFGIVAIGYNRPDSMNRLLTILNSCDFPNQKITLIISIDNCGDDSVAEVANRFHWSFGEKIVIHYNDRQGLRKHILKCGSYMNEYGLDAMAVFEDDVVPSPVFFSYMKQCTEKYYDNPDIAGISLYKHLMNVNASLPFQPQGSKYDVYFMQFAQSWGQVWMKPQWNAFYDWYETENDHVFDPQVIPEFVCRWPKTSWLKYHIKYCIEKNKYFVYPYTSYSTCYSEAGEHCGETTSRYQVSVQRGSIDQLRFPESLSDAVKYDAFFEYIDDSGICYDLYGTKTHYNGSRLLSEKILPYKVISSYSLVEKPHEMNYLNQISGGGMFLYDLSEEHSNNLEHKNLLDIVNYYYNYFPGLKDVGRLFLILLKRTTHSYYQRAIRKAKKMLTRV